MSTDVDFIADLERAARALRAATLGVLIAGARPEDVARIVRAGISDAERYPVVGRSRARVIRLGYVPTGDELPEPPWVAKYDSDAGDGHGEPGDWDYRPPSIHPMVGRRGQAA